MTMSIAISRLGLTQEIGTAHEEGMILLHGPTTVPIGALDGGSPCRLSILRNANVACLCHLFMAMSNVEFKK